jgi:hypothetical protein
VSGNYSVAAKNYMLDQLGTQALYVSVHTTDPGSTGTAEATGGSPAYARQGVTWNAAASGSKTASSTPSFDLAAGTYRYLGLWTAVTGGTYWGKILLPSAQTFGAQAVMPVSSTTLDLNAVASA